MTNIRGQIAMMPEKQSCYCSDPKPHWHAYEAVFDGDKWLPVTSQAGIELIMALQEEGAKRQEGANGFGLEQTTKEQTMNPNKFAFWLAVWVLCPLLAVWASVLVYIFCLT